MHSNYKYYKNVLFLKKKKDIYPVPSVNGIQIQI